MKKRIVSILLVLLMIVGMFPAVSLAATGATIVVKKVDESGAPLAGAVITMSQRIDGVPDYTATSDASGRATFVNIPDGAGYYVWESVAPVGYALSSDTYMLDIADGAGIVYGEPGEGFPNGQKAYDNNDPFVFVNEQYKANFYVTKTDGTAPLAGATFKLESNIAGRTPYTAVSDGTGKVTFNDVIDGYYILSETEAPAGYEKSDNVIYFKVENGEVKYSVDRNLYTPYYNTLSIQNTKIPTAGIELTKTDAQDAPLAGAVFHLTEEGKNEPAYEAISDADGKVRFEVVNGTYILSEYRAPAGYAKNTDTYKFKVDTSVSGRPVQLYDNGTYYDYEGLLTVVNEELVLPPATATFVIKKTDEQGAPLEGAVFHLTEGGQPEPAYEAVSDANGIVTFEDVVEGYYSLSEYTAPVGFIKSEERYNFYVNERGEVRYFPPNFPNGQDYDNDAPLTIKNIGIEPTVIEIPFTKTVVKGGTAVPEAKTFTFLVSLPFDGNDTPFSVSGNAVDTDGEGVYNGTIKLSIVDADMATEGILVQEDVPSDTGDWSYSDALWMVFPGLGFDEVYCFPAELRDEGNGPEYTFDANGSSASSVSFTNTCYTQREVSAELVIKKTDDQGRPLAGATFALNLPTGANSGYTATSDASGTVIFRGVKEGAYVLTETAAPDGYVKSNAAYDFYVTPNGDIRIFTQESPNGAAYTDTQPLVVVNTPVKPAPDPNAKGTAKLTKVDAGDPKTVLAGVCFDLYNAAGKQIGSYVTNKKGVVTVSGLKAGDYYWVETQPCEGYRLDNTPQSFTVVGGEVTSLVLRNSKTPVPTVFTDDHYAYIIGREDGLVHPEDNVTRAEVATIFFRLLNEKTRSKNMTKKNDFTDVKKGAWYNTAVSTMAAMGIINGRPDGSFGPDDYITRAEFAAIAARFEVKGNTTGASFNDIYKHWAKKEINIAANNGWVLGYEDGSFRPDQVISRVEAMTMVNRVLQRIPETVADLHPDMVTWPDNQNTKAWYYRVVQEATNSHNYVRKANGYEHWTGMRANPNWAALEK